MLNNLRPYAEALNAWLASNKQDESRLLRGQALEEALQWSVGRSLSNQDSEFLRASQTAENRETKQANQILTKANHKAGWMIRIGAGLLGVAVLSAGAIGLWSTRSISTAKTLTQLEKTSSDALKQFEFDQQEALLNALRATGQLKQLAQPGEKYPTSSPIVALQTILDNIRDKKITTGRLQLIAQGVRVTTSDQDKAIVWDFQGNKIASLKHPGQVVSATLSPDGQLVATTVNDSCNIYLWNLQGRQLATLKAQGIYSSVEFSPNSQLLMVTDPDRKCPYTSRSSNEAATSSAWGRETVRLYDLQGYQLAVFKGLRLTGNTSKPGHFSPQGDRILTLESSENGGNILMRLWDLQGRQWAVFPRTPNTSHANAAFSSDGQLIASVERDAEYRSTLSVWNVKGQRLATVKIQQGFSGAIQFSPNGQLIATGGDNGTIQLWNRRAQLIRTFKGYLGEVTAIQFSPDSQRIATIGENEAGATGNTTGDIWDLQGKRLDSFDGYGNDLQFSPDGSRILTTAYLKYLQNPHHETLGVNRGKIEVLRVSPKGDRIITYIVSEGIIRVWSNQGKVLASIKVGELARVDSGDWQLPEYAMQFNDDGDRILTFNVPKNPKQEKYGVHVWNLQGQKVAFLEGAWWNANLIEPKRYYASFVDNQETVRVWDLEGRVITTFQSDITSAYPPPSVNRVHLSPSGNYILVTGNAGGSVLRSLQGQQLARINELKSQKIIFSNDEQSLIALESNSIVKQWNLQGKPLTPTRVTFESEGTPHQLSLNDTPTVFNAKAGLFATASRHVFLWNLQRGQLAALDARMNSSPPFDNQTTQINDRGDRIATFGDDNKVRVWDNKGNQLAEYEGYKMALSADGQRIVVVSQADNVPRVWQVSDMDELIKRGCDWLRLAIVLNNNEDDRRLCEIHQ